MIATRFAVLALILILSACKTPDSPLSHEVYVWQRQWMSQHAAALAESHDSFVALRILAAQIHPQEGEVRARVDTALLAADTRPVVLVLRVDGEMSALNAQQIGALLTSVSDAWRSAGVNLRGIEIDFDCARSRLDAYAKLLAGLRAQFDSGLRLSITALPAWIGSPALIDVLAQVDEAVLQVHSVSAPDQGLFDAQRARGWIVDFAKVSPRPFVLALPAYSTALIGNGDGRLLVESEVSVPLAGARSELSVDPQLMRDFLDRLERDRPSRLSGIVWFRLPLPGDRRAWSLPMLEAVVQGHELQARIDVQWRESGAAFDLVLRNDGTLDSEVPATVSVKAEHCTAADGVGGYQLISRGDRYLFQRREAARLAAGAERVIGWLRCTSPLKGTIDVAF